MSRIFIINFMSFNKSFRSIFLCLAALLGSLVFCQAQASASDLLNKPLKELFSHAKHQTAFENLKISCVHCHRFNIKAAKPGPLASPVPTGFIFPPKDICHQCHQGKFTSPKPNPCGLCHLNTDAVKPADHMVGWREKHGKMASLDRDSCSKCHNQTTCDQCHFKIDPMNRHVHPGNFRLFHSIQARARPASCIECHKTQTFCQDCHSGKRPQ